MELRSEINITPLVDVVLVLLIIFMVVTPLMYEGYDVSVATKGLSIPGKFMLVEQTEASTVVINNTSIPVGELADRLRLMFPERDGSVIYSGADNLNYGDVAQTLDAIRDAGTQRIGITMENKN